MQHANEMTRAEWREAQARIDQGRGVASADKAPVKPALAMSEADYRAAVHNIQMGRGVKAAPTTAEE